MSTTATPWASSPYRISKGPGRASRIALIACYIVYAAMLVALGVTTHGFGLAWIFFVEAAFMLALALWMLIDGYRVAYEVAFANGWLMWRAPFLTIEVPMAEVTQLRRRRFPGRSAVLVAGGKRLLIRKRAGFIKFAVALGRALPTLQVCA